MWSTFQTVQGSDPELQAGWFPNILIQAAFVTTGGVCLLPLIPVMNMIMMVMIGSTSDLLSVTSSVHKAFWSLSCFLVTALMPFVSYLLLECLRLNKEKLSEMFSKFYG